MAGRANLTDDQQKRIAVTIHAKVDKLLRVPAGFAFDPEVISGTRPIGYAPRLECLFNRFSVHPSHHQDLATGLILRNRRNKTLRIIRK
jgi:hypothetical protein